MKLSKHSVFYNIFTLAVSNIGLQLLGFLYRIMLSRLIGAEGMGVFQLVSPFYYVMHAAALTGLTMAVSRLSAEHTALGNIHAARKALKLCFVLFGVFFSLASLTTVIFSRPISTVILGDERTRTALLIFLPCLLFTGVENLIKNYFFGTNQLKPPIISELSEQCVRIAAVAFLILYFKPADPGSSAALIASGMVISEIVSSSLLCLFYRKFKPKRYLRKIAPTPSLLRKILAIALPVSMSGVLNNLLSSAISILIPRRLIASGMSSSQALSLFGTMFGMTMPLISFPIAFIAPLTTVTVPKLSEGSATGNLSDMRRKAGKTIHATGLLAFPALCLFIPLGTPLCTVVYGNTAAGAYMLPLCISMLFAYYQITTTALLNGIGKQRSAATIILAGGVIELLFTWLSGIKGLGISAFLFGHIISPAICALLNFRVIILNLGIKIRWRNWFLSPIIGAALAGLTANYLFRVLSAHGIYIHISLVICLSAGVSVYTAALRALGTSPLRYIKTLIPQSQIRL